MRTVRGYALVEESEVRAATGEAGLQMRFGRDENSRPYHYWLTLFVTPAKIYVIEAGGEQELFEASREGIEASITAFRIE